MKLLLAILIKCFLSCHGGAITDCKNSENVPQPSHDTSLQIFPNKKISRREINKTLDFVQNFYERMATREQNLGYAEVKIEPGTPSHGLFIDSYPEPEATEVIKHTIAAVAASAQIAYKYCTPQHYDNEDCGNELKKIKLWKTSVREACHKLGIPCSEEKMYSKYRSMDGSCNDHTRGEAGQSFTTYGRLLYPNYLDAVKEIRRSVTKQQLPSARFVSANLHMPGDPEKKNSLALLFWGMFLEHDLSHTAMTKMIHTGKPIQCCDPDGRSFLPRYEHPFCLPIRVKSTDPYYGEKDVTCLSYVRSVVAEGPDCAMGPLQQMNQATHFLDGSQIYGTTKAKSDNRRNLTGGLLAVAQSNKSISLPTSNNPQFDCQQRQFNAPCYKSGDKRVNTDPHITALYTIWVKEHNRIASQLAQINPSWDDEEVFQEARRIVIAEMQHITYDEWIPAVLGHKIMKDYQPGTEPAISNEFATAAIRSLQSALIDRRSLTEEEDVFAFQFKSIDSLLKEIVTEKFAGRRLYHIGKTREVTYGLDILTIDIQRGRDHGLETYIKYRKHCGLSNVDTYEDLEDIMVSKAVDALKKSYKSVMDIDLIVGGLAEKPEKGLLGPTLSCIMKEQFERTMAADKYFYTNKDQPLAFSDSQMKEINKVTLARILCDNSEIDKVQPKVFEVISESNPQKMCQSEEIPRMDLKLWSVERLRYSQVGS